MSEVQKATKAIQESTSKHSLPSTSKKSISKPDVSTPILQCLNITVPTTTFCTTSATDPIVTVSSSFHRPISSTIPFTPTGCLPPAVTSWLDTLKIPDQSTTVPVGAISATAPLNVSTDSSSSSTDPPSPTVPPVTTTVDASTSPTIPPDVPLASSDSEDGPDVDTFNLRELFHVIDTTIPPEYRRPALPKAPPLERKVLSSNIHIPPPPEPEPFVYLPASYNLLNGLHLAYGGFFDPDGSSITLEKGNVPRYEYGRPHPTIPKVAMDNFFYTKSTYPRALYRLQQFDFEPGNSDVPAPPTMDLDSRFHPVSVLSTPYMTAVNNEDLLRTGLRAFSYGDQACITAGRLFQQLKNTEDGHPSVPSLVANIEHAHIYSQACTRSGNILLTRLLANQVLWRRDAFLGPAQDIDPAIKRQLRAQPIHETTTLFNGKLFELCPQYSIKSLPSLSAQIPNFSAPQRSAQSKKGFPGTKGNLKKASTAVSGQSHQDFTVTFPSGSGEAPVTIQRKGSFRKNKGGKSHK